MDRVTKSRPITPKMRHSYGSINSIIFSKGFLPWPPPQHACNFYINFKPFSCIKLFCGRERCVWEEGASVLSGPTGEPGLRRDPGGGPLPTWLRQRQPGLHALGLVVPGPRSPVPCTFIPGRLPALHPQWAALSLPALRWAPNLAGFLSFSLSC